MSTCRYIRPFARMSTGVDKKHNKLHLDSIARQRSPQSNGSVFQSVEINRTEEQANMAQSQRSRYLKTGAIIAFIFMVLVWLSPSKPATSSFTHGMCSPCASRFT
jgi:guanosine-diphosphatase